MLMSSFIFKPSLATVALLYFVIGAFITTYLCYTLYYTPLFDWATWDLEWVTSWLWMSTLDYYGAACCMSAIVAHSEKPLAAALWISVFVCLGSPFMCAYVAHRAVSHRSLALGSGGHDEQRGPYGGLSMSSSNLSC